MPLGKVQPVLSFKGGTLSVKRSGYAWRDGEGTFEFVDALLAYEFDGSETATRTLTVPRSELIALRDFLVEYVR